MLLESYLLNSGTDEGTPTVNVGCQRRRRISLENGQYAGPRERVWFVGGRLVVCQRVTGYRVVRGKLGRYQGRLITRDNKQASQHSRETSTGTEASSLVGHDKEQSSKGRL